jgi:hypothetical protein
VRISSESDERLIRLLMLADAATDRKAMDDLLMDLDLGDALGLPVRRSKPIRPACSGCGEPMWFHPGERSPEINVNVAKGWYCTDADCPLGYKETRQ